MVSAPDEVAYCTREKVQATLDQADAKRRNVAIDDGIRSGARDIEGICHRRFYPVTGIRYPTQVSGRVLWVNHIDLEVLTLTSVVVDGTTLVAGTDYYFGTDRAPYTSLRLYDSASASWSTTPRGNVLTGEFGGSDGERTVGALAGAVASASATSLTVSDSSTVGVGDLLRIGTERLIVTEKGLASTTATLSGSVTADSAIVTVPVSSGALVHAGEMVTVGAERMFVEDVAGNNLIVKRAQAASVLAAHSAADVVYAPRLCTVVRGAAGTTAATHLDAAVVYRNVPPSLVTEVNAALAINFSEQGKSGYARTSGAGDNKSQSGGTGVAAAIAAAVSDVYTAYGRQGRIGAC